MSAFCTQCGAPLPANQKFCTRCGTAVPDSNPPEAAAETKPAAPATSTTPPVSGFGKRRAILVAGLVVAGVALAAALILIGPQAPPSPPKSSTAVAPPKAVPPATPPATVAAPPAGSATAAIKASRWEGYTNTRYGVMIDYPADLFAIQPPPPDNAGRNFTAEKAGARFHIYSHANALNFSVEELQAEDVLDIGDAAAVKQNGQDWYQVVASKEAETIVRRVLLSGGGTMVHRLEIAYPKAASRGVRADRRADGQEFPRRSRHCRKGRQCGQLAGSASNREVRNDAGGETARDETAGGKQASVAAFRFHRAGHADSRLQRQGRRIGGGAGELDEIRHARTERDRVPGARSGRRRCPPCHDPCRAPAAPV